MRVAPDRWRAFVRPAKRLAVGDRIRFGHDGNACLLGTLDATVVEKGEDGRGAARLRPLRRRSRRGDRTRSAICRCRPTSPRKRAGRRARPRRLPDRLRRARRAPSPRRPPACISRRTCSQRSTRAASSARFVTLHVGAGTFLPVKADDTADHRMHAEWGDDRRGDGRARSTRREARAAASSRSARPSLRLLESAADEDGTHPRRSRATTDIFITPGYRFRAVDVLMTNFHLPRSTLFMLVVGLRRPRDDAGRLCPCDRAAATASIPTATPACSIRQTSA